MIYIYMIYIYIGVYISVWTCLARFIQCCLWRIWDDYGAPPDGHFDLPRGDVHPTGILT